MTDKAGGEIKHEIYVDAAPSTVFALLTDARHMTSWLAEIVEAEPRPGGRFRIAAADGTAIEGSYVEVVADRKVVFTWGGIMGLAPGQTTVEFVLEPVGSGTLVRLRHFGLPQPLIESHDRRWQDSGLPKLKSAAEGRDPGGRCLGDIADQAAAAAADRGASATRSAARDDI